MAEVFISYAREDQGFARKLRDALTADNRTVWMDETGIQPTAEWLKTIFENIEASDNFLFLITPDSVVSTYARKEIDHAALNHKRMVPIFYRAVPDDDVPEAVGKYQRIDFTGVDSLDAKFVKLIDALDTDLEWVEALNRLLVRAKHWEGKKRTTVYYFAARI